MIVLLFDDNLSLSNESWLRIVLKRLGDLVGVYVAGFFRCFCFGNH